VEDFLLRYMGFSNRVRFTGPTPGSETDLQVWENFEERLRQESREDYSDKDMFFWVQKAVTLALGLEQLRLCEWKRQWDRTTVRRFHKMLGLLISSLVVEVRLIVRRQSIWAAFGSRLAHYCLSGPLIDPLFRRQGILGGDIPARMTKLKHLAWVSLYFAVLHIVLSMASNVMETWIGENRQNGGAAESDS